MRRALPFVLALLALSGAASAPGCASQKGGPKDLGIGGDGGDFGGNEAAVGVSSAQGVGKGVAASECLDGLDCADDSDCPNGYHCNGAVVPPQCQKLYCGQTGTLCYEDNDCAIGLDCIGDICGTPCVFEWQACGGAVQCCSGPANCIDGQCDATMTATASEASAAAAAATSSTGGGSCVTCFSYLEGTREELCPGPALDAYIALSECICEPSNCANDCVESCGGPGVDTANCPACEETAMTGACSTEVSDCAAN